MKPKSFIQHNRERILHRYIFGLTAVTQLKHCACSECKNVYHIPQVEPFLDSWRKDNRIPSFIPRLSYSRINYFEKCWLTPKAYERINMERLTPSRRGHRVERNYSAEAVSNNSNGVSFRPKPRSRFVDSIPKALLNLLFIAVVCNHIS